MVETGAFGSAKLRLHRLQYISIFCINGFSMLANSVASYSKEMYCFKSVGLVCVRPGHVEAYGWIALPYRRQLDVVCLEVDPVYSNFELKAQIN